MSKEIISKELLSLVLCSNVREFTISLTDNVCMVWFTGMTPDRIINLDTLQRLCKEWLLTNVDMFTMYHHQDTVSITIVTSAGIRYSSPSMSVYTELQAVIKATEWVAIQNKLLK